MHSLKGRGRREKGYFGEVNSEYRPTSPFDGICLSGLVNGEEARGTECGRIDTRYY